MPAIILPVHDIDELGKDFSFELTADWLDSELADTPLKRATGVESGKLSLHAQQNGVEYLVNGQLDVELQVECSRCLGEVPLPIHTSVTALLTPRKDGGESNEVEVELDSEDLDRAYYEGHQLVLDELVREHIVIEAPMQPLCSPDCKGIAIPERVLPKDFGGEGAVDPRLAPLNDLKAKLSEKNKR